MTIADELRLADEVITAEAKRRRELDGEVYSAGEWEQALDAYKAQVRRERFGMIGLRDYFAAQVIGMAAHSLIRPDEVADRAYAIADAMLTAREIGR